MRFVQSAHKVPGPTQMVLLRRMELVAPSRRTGDGSEVYLICLLWSDQEQHLMKFRHQHRSRSAAASHDPWLPCPKMGWPTLVHRMFGTDLEGGTLLESPCSRTINSRTRDFMNPSYVSPFLKTGASIPMFRSLGRAPNISFRKKIFQIKSYLIHLLRSFLYVCLNLSHSHRQMTGSGCRLFMQYTPGLNVRHYIFLFYNSTDWKKSQVVQSQKRTWRLVKIGEEGRHIQNYRSSSTTEVNDLTLALSVGAKVFRATSDHDR